MSAVALPLKLKPVPVSNDSSTKLSAVDLAWPNMVPSAKSAVTLLFSPTQLPPSLHAPTLELLKQFDEKGLSAPPDGVALDAWLHAQAVVWRLKAAASLAQDALSHDEAALQVMFEEAAGVRAWLLGLANQEDFPGREEAVALRGLLQTAWTDVLDHAPAAPVEAPQRPAAKTGTTHIGPAPTRRPPKPTAGAKAAAKAKSKSEFDDAAQPLKLGRYFLFAVLALIVAIRVLAVESDLKAPEPSALEAPQP